MTATVRQIFFYYSINLSEKQKNLPDIQKGFHDLSGNRTRVSAVRGRRLSRLTNRPLRSELGYIIIFKTKNQYLKIYFYHIFSAILQLLYEMEFLGISYTIDTAPVFFKHNGNYDKSESNAPDHRAVPAQMICQLSITKNSLAFLLIMLNNIII